MPVEISFFKDEAFQDQIYNVHLTDTDITDGVGIGEPTPIYALNSGDTRLRGLFVGLAGDGAELVQLAQDQEGEPGVWAAPGESIIIDSETIFPKEHFVFWMRAMFDLEDREGEYPFSFVITGRSF